MNIRERALKAKEFADFWKDKGYEKGQGQVFWIQLLESVFEVDNIASFIEFENQVHIDKNSGFIDAYIPSTKILIEQKGIDKDLRKAIRQSDGSLLTPFQQAKKYIAELPVSKHPRYVITCNFKSFLIYDMEKPNGEPYEVLLENLETEYYRLQFLVNMGNEHLKKEMEVSIKAGDLVGKLYDLLLNQYIDKSNEKSLKSLNILCVRLVFCLYAEDAGLFETKSAFHDYLNRFDVVQIRSKLIELFKVLDTAKEDRDPYMDEELRKFPYVNGGLFSDVDVVIPTFTEEIKEVLLAKASDKFDWSDISPTIFGAIFESTLNPETRRSGGMHYTSIENIHKVIDPLFLDELRDELNSKVLSLTTAKSIKENVEAFQKKLASLKFLDPACGSGNFLTETYLSLRELENKALEKLYKGQLFMGYDNLNPIKVSIGQFYGIEINDFAVTVAKTALWIAESKMLKKTETILHSNLDFLPLKSYVNIVEGNALKIDWNSVVSKNELNYIMGNPPFVGARLMSVEQKNDLIKVFDLLTMKAKNIGNIDYVSGWYVKATEFSKHTSIECAFVSTNSVCQGEQVDILWKPLINEGIVINFAYKSFKWNSEAKEKASVFCIIVGFSHFNRKTKELFDDRCLSKDIKNINPYLVDAPTVFIESRTDTICASPKMGIGNKPIDGGYYLFDEQEKDDFIKNEPLAEKWFRKWYGSQEFIDNKPRYCLWLKYCPPEELRKMPGCLKRIEAVRKYRLDSKSEGTRKLAEQPTRFHVENFPVGTYIVIPEVSTDKRKYIPIGFMTDEVLCSNLVKITETADLYDFGVLISNVHMAWTRAVCGRLGNGYRYSVNVVYNNFPWPTPTKEQREKIKKTAKAILEARTLYPNSSLADLYDELTMPVELRKAHQDNDKAVMEAYGFNWKTTTESDCVAELMKMYQKLSGKDKTYERIIEDVLKPFIGMTQLDIFKKLGANQQLNGIPKNIGQMVTDLIFENSGLDKKEITVKNLPVNSSFEPLERMTFRTIKIAEFEKEWNESDWKKYFENLKIFVICYEGSNEIRNGYRILKGLKIIEFNEEDLESLRISYDMVKKAIENEDASLLPFPNSYSNQYLEVSPKGAGGVDAYNSFLKNNGTKICFALNKTFLECKMNNKELEHNKKIEKTDIVLNKSIYELEEIELIFNMDNREELCKEISESGYVIKDKYVIKSDLAINIEIKDCGDVLKFNEESINYSNTKKYLDGQCKKRKLYRVDDYVYITSEKLKNIGITKEDIEDSLKRIEEKYKDGECFSIESIFENDFMNKYGDLGFAKELFEYLLIDKKVNYLLIGDYRLYTVNTTLTVNLFFERIVLNFRVLTMNDIRKFLYASYKIDVPLQKIRRYVNGLEYYYDEILDKVYVDKNDYYKEVYNEE